MKIFGIEYKTRRELIEENEKLKAENKVAISESKYIPKYESYCVHKCYAKFIVSHEDESYLSNQRIREHLCEQIKQEIFEDIIFENGIDSFGRIVYSAEIPVLRKEENK